MVEFAAAATVALALSLSDEMSNWLVEDPAQVNALDMAVVVVFANFTLAGVVICKVAIVGAPEMKNTAELETPECVTIL